MIHIFTGVAVVALCTGFAWWLIHFMLTNTGDRAAPRRDRSLRPAPDRFTPGEVLPRTPQAGEPLEPLPAFTPDKAKVIVTVDDSQFQAKLGEVRARLDGLAPPEDEPGEAPASGNGHADPAHDALVARFDEHIDALKDRFDQRGDTRPGWLRELAPHADNDRAVHSMFTRAQALIVRALDDGEVRGG